MDIIDRRPNPHGKNLENRRRVFLRARTAMLRAARDAISAGKLRDVGKGEAVSIPADSLHEPSFRPIFTGGERDIVLAGNRSFSTGDRLKRPEGSENRGGGASGENGQDETDEYRFVLTRDEFLDLFFEDLELPDLIKRQISSTDTMALSRAGVSSDGSPIQLDLSRTMRYSMARRIGLKRPKSEELRELEDEIRRRDSDGDDTSELLIALATMSRKLSRVPWIDPIDLRYRRFVRTPKPNTRAVMFCLMDVSGSMTEQMKELAKRFFLLLHVFLERRYKQVDVVFIRHTEAAEEVDEQTFFSDPRTGGTIVSSALLEFSKVQADRYPADRWNIYVAQASDGDNFSGDTHRAAALLEECILPLVQHYAYIEISGSGAVIRGETDLWRGYAKVAEKASHLAMRQVGDRRDIFPVFRELFARKTLSGERV